MADIAVFLDDEKGLRMLRRLEKKVKKVGDGGNEYAGVVSSVVFQDIISHFEKQQGSEGPWQKWSTVYAEHMEKIGRSGNKILQDSGHLRQAFTPANYRTVSEGIVWYNPAKASSGSGIFGGIKSAFGFGFPYAAAHNQGGDKLPKRDFMWLSNAALLRIEQITLNYILEDR